MNSLVAIARDMRRKEEQYDGVDWLTMRFKLQFNVLELTRLFYDKVKDAQSNELTDLLNKRVLLACLLDDSGTWPKRDQSSSLFWRFIWSIS